MIFQALQSDTFRFEFHSLGSKILKIPEFNLVIDDLMLIFICNRQAADCIHPLLWSNDYGLLKKILFSMVDDLYIG